MEIRFSKDPAEMASLDIALGGYPRLVYDAACGVGAKAEITRVRHPQRIVRFTLWAADVAQHDKVIAALFDLDPDAVVRTARAIYESKADFEAQRKARVS